MKDEWLQVFRARAAGDLITVQKNNPIASANPEKYAWVAWYGDRCVFGRDADEALRRAWAVWGGEVAALVFTTGDLEHHACKHDEAEADTVRA